uniref:unspecific monooxygenase n=1 Tax=Anolis carolinensis TaxID=28377 RepID=A0A803TKM7_ANOCA
MEALGITTLFLVVFISCLVFSAVWKSRMKKEKLPPGPTPLPIIGNILQLKTNYLDQAIHKLSQKYGPVFTMYVGTERVVVLNGYDAVKEALIDRADEFSARGKLPLADKINKGKVAAAFEGTTESYLAMGKDGNSSDVLPSLPSATLGWERKALRKGSKMKLSMSWNTYKTQRLYNIFPSLMDFIPGPHHKVASNSNKNAEFVLEEAKEHRATLDPSSPRDYIDCFYIKMDQEEQNDASEFTIENLIFCVLDLFTAGTETTSTTLRYGLLILQKYPEIEAKVQEEIDQVIGGARKPCMADRGKMPYTDAVIHEIQRFISLVPLSVPHAVLKDTVFREYVIPKGTTIYPVLTSVLCDTKEFRNPTKFDPQHFLHEDGSFRKSDYFMPFSAGKRICAGEGLARMELFLFLTTILQNFKLKPLTDPKDIDISPQMSSIGSLPRSYQLCVVPR